MSEAPTLVCAACGRGENGRHGGDCRFMHPWLAEMERWTEEQFFKSITTGVPVSPLLLIKHMEDWAKEQSR